MSLIRLPRTSSVFARSKRRFPCRPEFGGHALRECILRPTAVAWAVGGRGHALLLLAELPRREAEAGTEGAAEMCGIAKTVSVGDIGNRSMRLGRIGQIGPGPLQTPLANVMSEIVSSTLKQFLQISFGDALSLGDARRRKFGIVEPPLDGLANPVHDRGLGRPPAGVRRGPGGLMRQCQQVDQALRDRAHSASARVSSVCAAVEHAGKHRQTPAATPPADHSLPAMRPATPPT